MKRLLLPLGLLLFGLSAALGKPNLLIILADDMGYGDLGCYGSKQIETPNLDKLAGSGVRCTDGYVSGNVCAPSRAGLLTGRYQQRFGFEHNLNRNFPTFPERLGIPKEQKTIADHLKAAGYRTGIIGKWHVGDSLEDIPHWLESPYWQGYNRRLYRHDYWLTQPEREDDYRGVK